ncbi:MAG: hypothetical protein GY864_14870, partial [Desulfobacterales bacterium]|nr:hypothetical protein [Desulfobacterales bacterium]
MPQYQYDINLREYWRILKKRKFTVLITAIALGLFSTIFAGIKAPAPLYTSTCSIKFEKVVSVEGIFSKSFSWSEETDVETMISVIKAYHVLEKTVKRMGTVPEGSPAENVAAIVSRLESKIEASREDYTNIINIGVTDPDPVFAQRFAKTLAETFKEMHAEEQNRRTEDALKYISRKLKEVQKNLREAEDTFNRFKQDNQLVSYDLQSESLLSSTKEINDQIRKIEEAKAEFNELLVKLERFIINPSGSDHSFYSTHTNKQYANINTTLVDLLLKRDSLLGDFTPKHPRIIEIERKIIENARKMSLTLHLEIKNVDKKKAGLEKLLAEVNFNTSALMDKKLEFDRLNREVDSYNNMAALLERRNQEALIAKAETPEEVTIVRPALLPIHPNNPPKTTATGLMGLLIGFILGMVLAFITETFDTSLAAIEDVEEDIGSQVLGIIPHWDRKGTQENPENKEQKEARISSPFAQKIHLAAHFMRNSMLAETFRSL